MATWRVFLDDAGECATQRAVLAALAAGLARREGVQVRLTSAEPPARRWADVPPAASRRLAVRLEALEPLAGTRTLFLPGHLVPGAASALVAPQDPVAWGALSRPLAADDFIDVGGLELFAADNASHEARALQVLASLRGDYESLSRHAGFTATPLPAWLAVPALRTAAPFTQRPWYAAQAPARAAWLAALAGVLAEGRLTLAQVEDDARHGRVRPSLPQDARRLLAGEPAAGLPLPDLTLDALFVVPACRVPPQRLALLQALPRRAAAAGALL
ncbi:hypothetical protein ACT80S_15075, partial [Ramlibacter sp. MAHUQ-53]|uniref:hypothetical protein n=1 Tax=unclassified Ramlibacter TaxID=2617605 RepID=UPI00363500A4